MPGIVGIVTKMPRPEAEAQLQRMVKAMVHESDYVTGTWVEEALGVYVGWVLRADARRQLPLRDARGEAFLVLSGEDFSGVDAARQADEDPSFPAGLNGRFQGLKVDRRQGTATLFCDRYGLHRLYYHESKDGFYFAAEAKAILAVRPELRRVNPQALGEFISCGCVLEDRTLFEGIQVLPAAAAWVLRAGTVEKKSSYFATSEWENQELLSSEAYYQELRDVFTSILPGYCAGPGAAMSLTGGLDTRMIMAWQKFAPQSLPCYSFSSTYRECQDVVMGRRVATACEQNFETIPLDQQYLSRFSHYAERAVFLTDGCCEVNRGSDLYANEQAKAIGPIRITGNYGGEVLRRVRAFKPVDPMPGLFQEEITASIRTARATYDRIVQVPALSFSVFRQAPWHHYGLLALEESQLSVRTPYLDNRFVKTVFRAPPEACADSNVCLRLIEEGDPKLAAIRTDRGLGVQQTSFAAGVLRQYLEFTFKAEYAYDYGMPQRVAQVDHALSGLHLERLFLGRHKFAHYRVWYRDSLSDYVRDTLLDPRALARPYVHSKQLKSVVKGHLSGERNYTTEIHHLLTLELIHRLFVD